MKSARPPSRSCNVGGADAVQRKPWVSTQAYARPLLALDQLAGSKPSLSMPSIPFFSAFHLTVDDRSAVGGFAAAFSDLEVQRMMAMPIRSGRPEFHRLEVIMHVGRQILGSALSNWQPVLRMMITSRIATLVCRRRSARMGSYRLDMRPFRIGRSRRITQFVAVVARAVVGSPRGAPQGKFATPENHVLIQLPKGAAG